MIASTYLLYGIATSLKKDSSIKYTAYIWNSLNAFEYLDSPLGEFIFRKIQQEMVNTFVRKITEGISNDKNSKY